MNLYCQINLFLFLFSCLLITRLNIYSIFVMNLQCVLIYFTYILFLFDDYKNRFKKYTKIKYIAIDTYGMFPVPCALRNWQMFNII